MKNFIKHIQLVWILILVNACDPCEIKDNTKVFVGQIALYDSLGSQVKFPGKIKLKLKNEIGLNRSCDGEGSIQTDLESYTDSSGNFKFENLGKNNCQLSFEVENWPVFDQNIVYSSNEFQTISHFKNPNHVNYTLNFVDKTNHPVRNATVYMFYNPNDCNISGIKKAFRREQATDGALQLKGILKKDFWILAIDSSDVSNVYRNKTDQVENLIKVSTDLSLTKMIEIGESEISYKSRIIKVTQLHGSIGNATVYLFSNQLDAFNLDTGANAFKTFSDKNGKAEFSFVPDVGTWYALATYRVNDTLFAVNGDFSSSSTNPVTISNSRKFPMRLKVNAFYNSQPIPFVKVYLYNNKSLRDLDTDSTHGFCIDSLVTDVNGVGVFMNNITSLNYYFRSTYKLSNNVRIKSDSTTTVKPDFVKPESEFDLNFR